MEKLRVVAVCDDKQLSMLETFEDSIPKLEPNLLGPQLEIRRAEMRGEHTNITFVELNESTIYVKANIKRLVSAKCLPEDLKRAAIRKGNPNDECLMIVPSELGGPLWEVNLVPVKKVVTSYGGLMVSRLVFNVIREWLECFSENGGSVNYQAMICYGDEPSFMYCLQLYNNGLDREIPCTITGYLKEAQRSIPMKEEVEEFNYSEFRDTPEEVLDAPQPGITDVSEDSWVLTAVKLVRAILEQIPVLRHLVAIFDAIRNWWNDGDGSAALSKVGQSFVGMKDDLIFLIRLARPFMKTFLANNGQLAITRVKSILKRVGLDASDDNITGVYNMVKSMAGA